MAGVLLTNQSTGQRVYATPGTSDYESYLSGGFMAPETISNQPAIPTGATKVSNPNELLGLTESQLYRVPNSVDIYKLPQTGTIAADSIKDQTKIDLSSTQKPFDLTNANSSVIGASETSSAIQKLLDSFKTTKTVEQQQADTLSSRINTLLGSTAGKTAALAEEENRLGINTLSQQLAQLNSDILTKTAEYKQLQAAYDQTTAENRSKPITMSSIIGNQAQIDFVKATKLNAKASDIQLAQAMALGLQGQISAAKDTAQRAIDLRYAPIEEEISIKQAQLELLKPTLTKQENEQAKQVEQLYNLQLQQVENERQDKTSVVNLMLQAPSAGITINDSLISAAQKASNYIAKNGNTSKLQVIGSYYDENGLKVDAYGFVDEKNKTVTPYNIDGTSGNVNFGMSTGTMLGLPMYNTQNNNPGINRPTRNNNPGNIKATANSIKFPGVVGIESTPATDGGNFLIFDTPQNGLNAIGQLLQSSIYSNLTAEQAIKKYNGGGVYGAVNVGLEPNVGFQDQISNPNVLNVVLQNLAKYEGFGSVSQTTPTEQPASPTVVAWAERINDGKTTLDSVPQNLKSAVNKELTKAQYNEAKGIKQEALNAATDLLNKFNAGVGTSAVGGNILNRLGVVGDWLGTGTAREDFIATFDQLKSSLSLDNVKLLKGQGQVSDAERRLLADASTKLRRSMSEPEFKNTLEDIIASLSNQNNNDLTGQTIIYQGKTYQVAANGDLIPQ